MEEKKEPKPLVRRSGSCVGNIIPPHLVPPQVISGGIGIGVVDLRHLGAVPIFSEVTGKPIAGLTLQSVLSKHKLASVELGNQFYHPQQPEQFVAGYALKIAMAADLEAELVHSLSPNIPAIAHSEAHTAIEVVTLFFFVSTEAALAYAELLRG